MGSDRRGRRWPTAINAGLDPRVKERIAALPDQFSEHRVRLYTSARENAPAAASKPKRVGLFIGVNKYRDVNFCEPHEEFRRSAEAMHKMFTSRGGIAPERAKLLLGEESTCASIEQAIVGWLPRRSEPGDTVFIYYCGHGGTVTNLDGSEPDGRDELITTFDNDIGKFDSAPAWEAALRKRTILDDTLARWLQELPGRQIVLLLDTCHGGGAVDAKGLAKFFSHEAARVKDISQLNMIVVAGCSADESVWFTKGPDALTRMPLYFMEAVEKLPAPVSVRQAYDYYLVQVQDYLRKINKAGAKNRRSPTPRYCPLCWRPDQESRPAAPPFARTRITRHDNVEVSTSVVGIRTWEMVARREDRGDFFGPSIRVWIGVNCQFIRGRQSRRNVGSSPAFCRADWCGEVPSRVAIALYDQ